jgi:hypothetical protein
LQLGVAQQLATEGAAAAGAAALQLFKDLVSAETATAGPYNCSGGWCCCPAGRWCCYCCTAAMVATKMDVEVAKDAAKMNVDRSKVAASEEIAAAMAEIKRGESSSFGYSPGQ